MSLVPGSAQLLQAQPPDIEDLFDSGKGPSAFFDLTDTPLWLTLLQMATLEVQDVALKAKFLAEFDGLRSTMDKGLQGNNLGYLLSVEMYADDAGTIVIPQGQILYPIGVGTEPVDALAEHMRKPQLRGPKPTLTNRSYHIWITNKDGKLAGRAVPREARNRLMRAASDEATRRERLGNWQRALPDGFAAVQRAEYWSEVARQYKAHLSNEERRRKVDDIVREFQAAQDKFNVAYKKYFETAAALARSQSRQRC